MKKIRNIIALFALGFTLGVLTGCTNWEQDTFKSLAASKAVIDQAQTDYEARTIPHTTPVYAAITNAKNAQAVAVNGLLAYEELRTANGTAGALGAQQQLVITALNQLPPLIASIKTLYAGLTSGTAPPAPHPAK